MNRPLIFGGIMSVLAAFLHIAIIIGGPEWYLFFGAGEKMATLAGQGSLVPTVSTLGIFTVLFIWGIYAFSGAGFIKKLPFLKPALLIISGIYLIRGLALFPVWIVKPEFISGLHVWSSLACLVIGFSYAIGTRRVWSYIPSK
jgi:putative oxidoreductase